MSSPRKLARVNHLCLGHGVKHMLGGRFSVPSIMESTGLAKSTVRELLGTFERLGLITQVGKDPDCTGRKRVLVYEIARSAISDTYRLHGAAA